MPQSVGVRAKEIKNIPEHTHERAAVSHGQSEHLSSHELSGQATEKSRQAHEQAEKLIEERERLEKPDKD